MKKIIEENIELLKEKLDLNKQILDENRENLRAVIQQPHSKERTEQFFRHYQISLELSSRSCHFIKMQNELTRSIKNNNGFKSFGKMSLS
jgi:DNA-binding protein H-NS